MGVKVCCKCNKEKDTEEFGVARAKKDGLQSYCKFCNKEAVKKYVKTNPLLYKEKRKKWDKNKKEKRYAYIIEYLSSHCCVDCGEKDIVVLQLDHIKPILNGRGRRIGNVSSPSKSKFMEEASKCVVRCANCHVRRHRRDAQDYRFKYNADIS